MTFCAPRCWIAIRRPRTLSARSGLRTHGPTATYLQQRRLFIDASAPAGIDVLGVEERVVGLLDRVLTLAYNGRPRGARTPRLPSASELADAAKAWT
jgi:hypothetical protein